MSTARDKIICVPSSIRIQAEVLQLMIGHARQDLRIECCGLLAGRDGIIRCALPAENVAVNRATSYEVATKQVVQLMREIRAAGLEMLGIYHSHPNGKSEPSRADIAMVSYPDVAYFIVSPAGHGQEPIRAFLIQDGQVEEVKLFTV
jgi:proteasome lid subunit RPN8/RPN11